jgi:hypothetical protein
MKSLENFPLVYCSSPNIHITKDGAIIFAAADFGLCAWSKIFFNCIANESFCQAQILLRKRKFSGILELLVGGVFNFLGRTQAGRLHSQQCAAAAVA